MWLFTKHGFFSIVRKSEDAIHVRARCRAHLEALHQAAHLPAGVEILQSYPGSDYPWRIILQGSAQLADVLAELGRQVDYSNFKNALASDRSAAGRGYLDFAHKTWDHGVDFQQKLERE